MGNLTTNLSRGEFECPCCGEGHCDFELVTNLQGILDHFKEIDGATSIIINSAMRCEAHNKAVGGAALSKHRLGIAADFVIPGVSIAAVNTYVHKLAGEHRWGIGTYETFVHLDMRAGAARWEG
jgi:uncharacterized protein YcbK (DUF882 family)